MATLGPASNTREGIRGLIVAGANAFRLNMSHGDHGTHERIYHIIREVADELGEPIGILADLCGPKIRAGHFEGGSIFLVEGESVTVTTRSVMGKPGLIPSAYDALASDVIVGNRILLDDGLLELRVEAIHETEITCTVIEGGTLKDRKGMNLPGVRVSAPSLTDKDREDARFALEMGVDLLALSFVRRAADIQELRDLTKELNLPTGIIAKIEKPEALGEIDDILAAADGVMVARGDLGVELPPEEVPAAQDSLVNRARAADKPVIVATQMLESMVTNSRPTRAEVSDVSHAVHSGADAVMLSAETASGAHPEGCVRMMDRIARQAESFLWKQGAFGTVTRGQPDEGPETTEHSKELQFSVGDAVARATALISRDLLIRAIFAFTRGGTTARVMSAARPAAPLVALTGDAANCRRMNLLWGVIPVLCEPETSDPLRLSRELALKLGLATPGQPILLVSGFNPDPRKELPSITVAVA